MNLRKVSYNKQINHIKHEKNNLFIYSTSFTGDIIIYDLLNNSLIEKNHIKIGKDIIDENDTGYEIKGETIKHTDDICTSNEYFYVLYSGQPMNSSLLKNYILKINSDGKIENCYLANIPIEGFCVSNDDKNLFVITLSEEGEYKIVKASLPA